MLSLAVFCASLLLSAPHERIEIEAESFVSQERTDLRRWVVQTHPEASGGKSLQVLPDTRRTHDDKLIAGDNFSNKPGEIAVVHYRIDVKTPGRYFVWVRAFSTGTEDNGVHAGIDGQWPASGARLQWCEGKRTWRWESKQRTQRNHCGEPGLIYLDIATPGPHTLSFSMREDGFHMDRILLTTDPAHQPNN